MKSQAEKPVFPCPVFYIRQLLALCIFLFILSSFANNTSQEPVFASLLANGHCIYVVLELLVTQDDGVGCAGLGTGVTALVQYVASRYTALQPPLPLCAWHFSCASFCQICSGCYFYALNSSQSEVGQIRTAI